MDDTLTPWRTALEAAAVIAAANLLILGGGHLSGADMHVAQGVSAGPTKVGIGSVLLMSSAPAILGGVGLWLTARRGPRAWRTLAWLGLALGVVTTGLPLSVRASAATSATLASMHLVAGLVWFVAVAGAARRHATRSGRATARPEGHDEIRHQRVQPAPEIGKGQGQ